MQQGNNQVVSSGSTGTAGVSETSRIGSVMVNQAYNWSDIKYAVSNYGYGYQDETIVPFKMLNEIFGNNRVARDLTLMVMSYSHPLYKYQPVFAAVDTYASDCKFFMDQNIFWYMDQWVLIYRQLQKDEDGYKDKEIKYTRQWQTRQDFKERADLTALDCPFSSYQGKMVLNLLAQLVYHNDPDSYDEENWEPKEFKRMKHSRYFCIWLKDYSIQIDNASITIINRDDQREDNKINWRGTFLWKDFCDYDIPKTEQELEEENYFNEYAVTR